MNIADAIKATQVATADRYAGHYRRIAMTPDAACPFDAPPRTPANARRAGAVARPATGSPPTAPQSP